MVKKTGKKTSASSKTNDVGVGIVFGSFDLIDDHQFSIIEAAGGVSLNPELRESVEDVIAWFIALHDGYNNESAEGIGQFPKHSKVLEYLSQLKPKIDALIDFAVNEDGVTYAARKATEDHWADQRLFNREIQSHFSAELIGLGRAVDAALKVRIEKVKKVKKGGHPANEPFAMFLSEVASIYHKALNGNKVPKMQKKLASFALECIKLTGDDDGSRKISRVTVKDYSSEAQLSKRLYEIFRKIRA